MSKENEHFGNTGGTGAAKDDSIVIDYFKLTQKYQKQYGDTTLLLMQVGSFFEVYSIRNPFTGTYDITPIQSFADQCNLNIAEKRMALGTCVNPTITSVPPFPGERYHTSENAITKAISAWIKQLPPCPVVMAGVRDHQLDKYIQKMVDAGFTVVIYVQEKKGKDFVRVLHEIHSPGTYLSADSDITPRISNHITCIWLSQVTPRKRTESASGPSLLCGMASMNIFTGESYLAEYQTPLLMNPTTFDELDQYLTTIMPSEIVLVSELPEDQVSAMLKYLSWSDSIPKHYVYANGPHADVVHNCTKQTYIREQLANVFCEDTFSLCTELQSNIIATQAFCYLIHFVENHNSDLTKKIQFPVFTNTSSRVVLANHTLKQLNIVPDGTYGARKLRCDSVVSLLNQCQTSMGKRRFEYQLVHPVFDASWLNREYGAIDHVLSTASPEVLLDYRRDLRGIRDMERMLRQMVTQRMLPSAIAQLYQTMTTWKTVLGDHILTDPFYQTYVVGDETCETYWNDMTQFLDFLDKTFWMEHCAGCHSTKEFDEPILRPESFAALADCLRRRDASQKLLETIQRTLCSVVVQGTPAKEDAFIRLHKTDKSGISLQITKKRGTLLKEFIQSRIKSPGALSEDGRTIQFDGHSVQWSDIQLIKASANYDEITFPLLKQLSQELLHMDDELNRILAKLYSETIATVCDTWYPFIEKVAKHIASWDVLIAKAYVAYEYRYCRPRIEGSADDDDTSYVKAIGLRHALIERIQTQEIYVTNDVAVGMDPGEQGILLYGTNAVGKTSLIRALGVAVIMAQAGCYVPCSEFHYRPYRALFSRILGNDNLFKGLSTFAVEMSELRLILKMADSYSLVLGDELCSGTEIESALSIFMAGIMRLYTRKASFLFATHFHEILKFQELHDLPRIAVKHMSVVYDPHHDCLVYDRLLKPGPGNGTYGIEVAKSMHMETDFIEQAYQIRHKYFNKETIDVLERDTSRYNAQKITGLCEKCHSFVGEEVHHLQYQQHADKQGFIGHVHKNHAANLMTLCKTCHDQWHHEHDVAKKTANPTPSAVKMVRKKTTQGYKVGTLHGDVAP
jgi:DNA mismatch repair protein MutS